MTLDELTDRVRTSVGHECGLKAKVKFVFGEDGRIVIDGRSEPNTVGNDDADTDITLTLSKDNFERIIMHDLSPQMALMTGKMRLKGDMRVALRLNPVFGVK